MNKVVLKWVPLPAIVVLLLALSPSQAETPRLRPQKPAQAVAAQKVKPVPPAAALRTPPAGLAYASADPGCTTARKRLWTEAGWMVRRVTSCR